VEYIIGWYARYSFAWAKGDTTLNKEKSGGYKQEKGAAPYLIYDTATYFVALFINFISG
jgi:hypothetical protein